uniref:Uncharacterized protein n=1 Tax=Anguilla anguilla TaxID=7936 RepID=A0A0E9SSX1_ANGAN
MRAEGQKKKEAAKARMGRASVPPATRSRLSKSMSITNVTCCPASSDRWY